ncbi:MAG: T9SS type B sorting domain-containing protein, partial [Flavobacterium sp.]|nr:T9SS type B sorting domain-containing protein [Flavobacterium sp.]
MKKLLLFFMSFFTLLGYAQFPEGFENAAIALNTSPPATGWATFNNGIGTNNWIRSNTQTPRGTALARISQQSNVTNSINSLHWLVSPQVTIPANGQVRFYSKQGQQADFNGEYTVRISTTSQTDPTTFTTVQTYDEATVCPIVAGVPAWEQKFVLLPAYVGQTVYIAFVKKNAGGDIWVIDDVKVDSQCLTPTALTATPLATSASLSWTSPNPAGPWVIEYGLAGFVPGTGTIVNAATNPFPISGLTSLTGYTFYVRTMCDTDNPSPWSNSGNFTTSQLPPECGGNFVDTGGVAANYGPNQDYVVTICPPNPGDYVTVTFTSFNVEPNWDKLYVYDGNSTAAPQIASANGPGNGTVLIPGAYWGTAIPGPFEATGTTGCLTFRFVSDGDTSPGWTSNIVCQPYPTCRKPTNITSNAISPTSVTVSWTNNAPSATLWEVIAVPVGSPAPTAAMTGQTTTNPTTYTYTGLNSQTAYNFYVRAICATGTDVGPWSTTFSTSTTNPDYCGGDHFYDTGGATGNYGNNETRTWTICPTNTGDVVTVYFNSFNLISSIGDSLTIYDGNSTAGTVVGTFYGTNIISSYTASSPSGCLTFRFVSNGTLNAAGWDATIICGPPCPSITSVLNSTVPAAGTENTIRVCQGDTVQFNGSGTFAASGTGATYVWNFDDGTTATGQNVSHAFADPGIYLVNLTITDASGCRNNNRLDQKVYVSTTPSFTGTQAADDDICLGQSTTITGAVTPSPFTRVCAPPVSGTTFLPDGAGNSYISFVPVDCFPFGSTITSANQITSVCIDMEHSYLGDLEIRLVSPTGQSIILKAYPGGGGTYLGCPLDDPAIGPGTGRTYCFTPSATTLLLNGPTTPCGTPSSASINAGNYMPVQPFTNLIGSQLNGNWSIIVTDNLGIDNGYIFNWSINFDNSILPTDYSFTPTIVNTFWSPSPSIVSTSGQTITVTPTTAGNQCFTYNAVDNFGCTYSQQVCIDVAPGVSLTSNTANPLSVYVGQNGTYYFAGGTPNAIVTYNVNGGANQQVTLDALGNATVVVNSLAVNTTVTATRIEEQPVVIAGNVILTTGGINPTNSHGPIEPAGTTATTANATTVDFNNDIVTLKLGHQLPIGTVVTISIAKNNNQGSVQITDGTNTATFDSGAINVLQRISFTMGRVTDIITITRNAGNVFVDGVAYTFNIPGCDAVVNLPATVTVTPPPFPFITSITNDTNICLGSNAVFTVSGSANTTVTYSINGGSTQTILLDGAGLGTITVANPTANVNLLVSQIQLGTDIDNITLTRTVIVNPLGQVNSITSQTVCQGVGTAAVVFSTSNTLGTTTYTWTNDNPAIGLAASSAGAVTGIPSFVAQNATTAPISGLITVVPTYTSGGVSCIGTATTFTITVNPTPQITNKTAAICSGATFTVTPTNGTASDILAVNTTYSWTYVDNPNVTGESNQSNQTAISQQLFNTTTAAQTVTYTVTPTGSNGCIGNTFTVTVTVNPEPVVTNQTVATCSDVALNYSLDGLITGAGDTYTYTVASSNATSVPAGNPRTVASAANITDSYTNTTAAPVTITYTVTPTNNGCIGSSFTVTATINPEPLVTNQTVVTCSDVALNYDLASLLTGTGDTYTYTVASSDATNVPAGSPRTVASAANITDVYTNTTTAPVTITYTVTPIGSNSCTGNTFTVTATINPEPVVSNQTVTTCSDVALNYSLDGLITGAGDTYTYTVASSNATSVPAGNPRAVASATNITDVYTNTTTAPVTITYTVTPIGSNGCTGNIFTIAVTVNPEPVVTNQTVATCSDVALNYSLDGLITGAGDTYTYTVASSDATNVPAGNPRTVASAANITDVYTNTTTAPVIITYTVTPTSSTGCVGSTFTVAVTVNPEPLVTNQTVATCSDVALNYDLASLITGTGDTYTYTVASSDATNVPAGNPRTVASAANITDLYTNTTTAPVIITYTVTPIGSNGCTGNTFTVAVTVNPEPVVSNQTAATCSDVALNFDLDALIAGIGDTFTYTVASSNATSVPAGNPRAVASAANITDIYTNTTTAPVIITYTVTPIGSNGCTGNTFSVNVTVDPIATVVATPVSNFICTGSTVSVALSTPTTGTAPVTYSWTAAILTNPTAGTITGFSSDNTGTLNTISQILLNTGTSVGIVRYVVTPFVGLCPGTPINVDITVNPLGQVDAIANQVVCPGDATTLVAFASSNTGTTTYTWTNDTPSIGLAASGSTSTLPSFTALNSTDTPIIATITVTPTFVDGAVNCLGTSTTFTITVNPSPTLILSSAVSSTNQIICVNAPITPIQYTFGANATGVSISGLPAGVTYAINGSIVTISGTPTTTLAGIFNYTITATGNACGAPNLSGTIEVTNGILPLFNQVVPVCQGSTINIPTTSTNGIVGVWNLISTTANDVTYQFIPNAGQCALNTTMTIVVHPLPVVTPSVTTQSFCSGGTTNINLISNVPGATFSWTATATTITGQAGSVIGSGATSINQTLVLNPNQVAAGQVTYVIVAEANGCLGAPVTVVVTVNPVPNVVVSPAAQTICSGQATSISFSGAINNTVFTWNVLSSVGVSGAFNGTGNAINQTLTTTGLSQGTVVYVVTPSLNGCVGTPQTVTVTVNPVPELFGSATHPELCSGESTFISVSTFSATTVFNWVVEPFGVSGASAGTATGSSILIEQALSTTGTTRGYVDYIITPVLSACAGTPITVRVYVNPLPFVSLTDGTICVDAAGIPFQTYLLDSGLDNANYDFVWTFEGDTIPNATQATYSASEVGTYTVVATNSTTNCVSNVASAVVTATNPATSLTVTQTDYFSDNATLTIDVTGGNGTLLYQLDAGMLEESNVFIGVSGGPHTITVVDTQGCTYLTQEVLIIDYPRYFTPNGDGHNDTWNILGLNQPDAKLFIFDRYGKLIKQIVPTPNSEGWDGTYNNALLPST